MHILDTVKGSVSGAINFVVDKNRKISLINKVKHVIRDEEKRANEAYIALGKYYYHNLRDDENNETALYCAEADRAERRLQRAELKLDELLHGDSEIYNFDDESYEDFCRQCEEDSCDGCAAASEDWTEEIPPVEVMLDTTDVTSALDVELPPQVIKAMDAHQKEVVEAAAESAPSEVSFEDEDALDEIDKLGSEKA